MIKIHLGLITKIKGIIQEKNNSFKVYHNNSSNIVLKTHLRNQVRLNNSIECAKEPFYNKIANKLNDTQKNAKAYFFNLFFSLMLPHFQ